MTWVLAGCIEHRDSSGFARTVTAVSAAEIPFGEMHAPFDL